MMTTASGGFACSTLMSNHFHLFLRTPQPNLAAGMRDLNAGYAAGYNRRHRRVGSLFQEVTPGN